MAITTSNIEINKECILRLQENLNTRYIQWQKSED